MTTVAMNNYSKQIKNARRPQAKKQPRAVSVGEALMARQLDAMKIPYTKETIKNNGHNIFSIKNPPFLIYSQFISNILTHINYKFTLFLPTYEQIKPQGKSKLFPQDTHGRSNIGHSVRCTDCFYII